MNAIQSELKNYNNCESILNYSLPNDDNEISNVEHEIDKLKIIVDQICENNLIDDYLHNHYYDEIATLLDYLGQLSIPAFIITDQLEELYNMKFAKFPKIGRKLCDDHCEQIHRKYSILKNRCHRLLDDLDIAYITKFNNLPFTEISKTILTEQDKQHKSLNNLILPKNWLV